MAEAATAQTKDLASNLEGIDNEELLKVFASLPATYKTRVKRLLPTKHRGVLCSGYLETVENEVVDDEYLKAKHGGGTFECKITRPDAKGRWVYLKQYTIVVGGNPLLSALDHDAEAGNDDGNSDAAVRVIERQLEHERRRSDHIERQRGSHHDSDFIRSITEPLVAQNEQLTEQLNQMRQQLGDALNRPQPRDEFKDTMLKSMMDQDTARVRQMREAHDTELRTVRERYEGQIDRLRDQYKEDMRDLKRSHERELKAIETSYERMMDNTKHSLEAQLENGKGVVEVKLETLRSQIAMLERQLSEERHKCGELEKKKNKTIVETAAELAQTAESFKTLGLIKEAEEGGGGKWYERAIGAVVESPAFSTLVGRFAGIEDPDAAAPAAGAQQLVAPDGKPPLNVPFRAPDGKIYVRTDEDEYREVDPNALRRAKARKQRDGEGEGEAPEGGGLRPPSDEELKMATRFIENALKGGTDPVTFAQSARSMIPPSIFGYIQHVGIDDFLNRVAQLSPGSPLTDQVGRKYVRDVAKALLGTS